MARYLQPGAYGPFTLAQPPPQPQQQQVMTWQQLYAHQALAQQPVQQPVPISAEPLLASQSLMRALAPFALPHAF